MTTDNVDFSRYGKRFQETLAQMILDDRPFCDQMEEVLNINFFEFNKSFLQMISNKIVNSIRGINRVVYDITSKPPSTIELE